MHWKINYAQLEKSEVIDAAGLKEITELKYQTIINLVSMG